MEGIQHIIRGLLTQQRHSLLVIEKRWSVGTDAGDPIQLLLFSIEA